MIVFFFTKEMENKTPVEKWANRITEREDRNIMNFQCSRSFKRNDTILKKYFVFKIYQFTLFYQNTLILSFDFPRFVSLF